MWTCPKCGHEFYNKNQSHSCGKYSVDDFLKGKTEKAVELFNFFLSEYKQIGDFQLHPVKTRIALLTKMRFCSINKIGKEYVDIHLVLTEPHNNPQCFYRIDNLANRFFVHHIKIHSRKDINDELKKYMILAYKVGKREHVKTSTQNKDDR
jgi:uncharacterized protein DUF5655